MMTASTDKSREGKFGSTCLNDVTSGTHCLVPSQNFMPTAPTVDRLPPMQIMQFSTNDNNNIKQPEVEKHKRITSNNPILYKQITTRIVATTINCIVCCLILLFYKLCIRQFDSKKVLSVKTTIQ